MVATGAKYVSQLAVTDLSLPLLPPDSVMPFGTSVASGVLGCWDMAHSSVTVPGGAANGLVVPNVAFAQAKALIGGSPAAADLGLTFTTDSSFVDNTTAHFERTGKGALHGIISQVNNTAARQAAALTMATTAASVMAYVLANPTHAYYMSLWDALTRVGAAGCIGSLAGVMNNATTLANRLFIFNEGTTLPVSGTSLGTLLSQAPNVLGAGYMQAANTPYGGTPPALGAAAQGGVYWGSTGASGANYFGALNKHPSHIFYRLYLEDLTVSARTFAQISALDAAAYAAAFAVGGRFNADTYTAPSALP